MVHHPNQARATDITYTPYAKGSMYVVAIIDSHSGKELSWRLSNTVSTDFCFAAPYRRSGSVYSAGDIQFKPRFPGRTQPIVATLRDNRGVSWFADNQRQIGQSDQF